MKKGMMMDRRHALMGMGAAAAGLTTASMSAGAKAQSLPAALSVEEQLRALRDPMPAARTLARLQSDLSGRTIYAYSAGQVFGLRAGRGLEIADYGKRLYGYEGCSVRRSVVRADGKIETTSRSWLFYKDLERGTFMDRFTNPYTGKTVDVPVFRAGISGEILGANGLELKANFGLKSSVFGKPVQLDIVQVGDRAVVTRHGFTQWTPPDTKKPRTEFTMDSWACSVKDLLNADAPAIPATYAWTSQTEWQSWLGMPADMDGSLTWRAEGTNVYAIEDLPQAFVQHCMARDPNLLTAPLA